MVGRERIEDGMCGITRERLTRITKPIVAAINGWCVGHGVELAMACDIRIASERAQFGTLRCVEACTRPTAASRAWSTPAVSV
jgi:hypothetical protein